MLGGRVAFLGAGLLTGLLLTRLLPPRDVGTYLLAFSVVTVGAVVAALGLQQVVMRLIAESLGTDRPARARDAAVTTFKVAVVSAVVVGLAYVAIFDIAMLPTAGLGSIALATAVWMAVQGLQTLVAESHRGFRDVRTASVLGGPFAAVLVTCSLGTLWLAGLRLGLTAIVWLTVVCIVVSTIVPAVLLWRRVMALPAGGDPTQTVEARELLHIGGPLLVTSLVLIAGSQGDLWVVAALRPDADVAVYGVAVRTATLVGFPLFVATAVLAPVIAQMYARGQVRSLERLLRLSATVATVPALLLFALFFLVGSPLLGVTYGDFYRRGAVVLALLSAGQLASVGAGVCGLLLSVTGHQRLLMTVTAVVGVFTMVSVVVLTHAHGIVGAATAACLGLVGQNVGMVIAARRTTGIRTQVSAAALRRWWGERHSDESLPGTSDRQASA